MRSPYDCILVSNNPLPFLIEHKTHRRETIPIKHHSMQQLPKRKRLQHPAPPPRRPRPHLIRPPPNPLLPPPHHAILLGTIPPKLQRPKHGINRHRHPELLTRIHPERQPRQRRPHSRRIRRRQRSRRARVPHAKRRRRRVQQVHAQARQEPKQQAVQQQDRTQRQRQPQGRRFLLFGRPRLLLLSAHKPRRHSLPRLHARARRDKDAQRMADGAGVVVVHHHRRHLFGLISRRPPLALLWRLPFGLPLAIRPNTAGIPLHHPCNRVHRGRAPPQDARPRDDVFVEEGVFARRDGVAQGIAEDDGVAGGRGGLGRGGGGGRRGRARRGGRGASGGHLGGHWWDVAWWVVGLSGVVFVCELRGSWIAEGGRYASRLVVVVIRCRG